MSKTTVLRKIGASLRSVIPPNILREYGLQEGDAMSWTPAKGGILVTFTKVGREIPAQGEVRGETVEAA